MQEDFVHFAAKVRAGLYLEQARFFEKPKGMTSLDVVQGLSMTNSFGMETLTRLIKEVYLHAAGDHKKELLSQANLTTIVGEMSVRSDRVPSSRHQQSNLKSPLRFRDKSYAGAKIIHGKNHSIGLLVVNHPSHAVAPFCLLTSCS